MAALVRALSQRYTYSVGRCHPVTGQRFEEFQGEIAIEFHGGGTRAEAAPRRGPHGFSNRTSGQSDELRREARLPTTRFSFRTTVTDHSLWPKNKSVRRAPRTFFHSRSHYRKIWSEFVKIPLSSSFADRSIVFLSSGKVSRFFEQWRIKVQIGGVNFLASSLNPLRWQLVHGP